MIRALFSLIDLVFTGSIALVLIYPDQAKKVFEFLQQLGK
jgi:hypothetical protein